jgi:hypothetical protein
LSSERSIDAPLSSKYRPLVSPAAAKWKTRKGASAAGVLGGEDALVAQELLVLVLLLDQDPERVAVVGVVVEVEVVREHVDEERDQLGRLAGRLDRRVQRRVDDPGHLRHLDPGRRLIGQPDQGAGRVAHGPHRRDLRQHQLELADAAVPATLDAEALAVADGAEVEHTLERADELVAVGRGQAAAPQDPAQAVALADLAVDGAGAGDLERGGAAGGAGHGRGRRLGPRAAEVVRPGPVMAAAARAASWTAGTEVPLRHRKT